MKLTANQSFVLRPGSDCAAFHRPFCCIDVVPEPYGRNVRVAIADTGRP